MVGKAVGIIETVGLAAAIEAADACVKSANIELIGYENTKGGGYITVKIEGDVGAVKAAIDASCTAAARVNKVISVHVIPRPHQNTDKIVFSQDTVGIKSEEKAHVPINPLQYDAETVEKDEECEEYKKISTLSDETMNEKIENTKTIKNDKKHDKSGPAKETI